MHLTERILVLMSDIFKVPVEQLGPMSSPDTVAEWDSMHHLNLVLALEAEFDLQFTPEEIEQLLSVELIQALIEEKTGVAK
jgi:acyl carrier protein